MDQQHYMAIEDPEEFKQLIKVKQDLVTQLKAEQLNLKDQLQQVKGKCDQLASHITSSGEVDTEEQKQRTVELFNSMTQYKTVGVALNDCDQKLWTALEEFTSLMHTKFHLEQKHGIVIDLD